MAKYQIEVKVTIKECSEESSFNVKQHEDGSFKMVIDEVEAISIDKCERALLMTNYPAIREAISKHLSELSIKATKRAAQGELIQNKHPYLVDGEVGRFEFCTHKVLETADMAYDTSKDLFPVLGPKEWYRTSGFKEIALIYGTTQDSYRQSSAMINRIRYQQEGGTPSRTLRDNTEREGARLLEHAEKKSEQILEKHDFSTQGIFEGERESMPSCPSTIRISEEKVAEAIEACSHGVKFDSNLSASPVPYEDPSQTVNISIDDVIVKEQKSTRKDIDSEQHRKYVHNIVIHIQ